jgi:phage protein D/phage baseplate assembly protein gpV
VTAVANESFTNSLLVEVTGIALAADVAAMLAYAYVDDSRNVPDMFVLRFRDPDRVVLQKAHITIGAKVTIKVQTAEPTGPQPLLIGEVTAIEMEVDSTGTVTEVRGLDVTHRLFRGRRVAAYPNMTVTDVVRQVVQKAGLTPGTIDPTPGVGGDADTQISQCNESDWEFLSRLADLVGAQINVPDGKSVDFKMPVKPDAAPDTGAKSTTNPLVLEVGRNLTALRIGLSAAEQVPSVQASGWDPGHKQELTATATPSTAGTEAAGIKPTELAGAFKAQPFLATDPSWRSSAEVKAAAEALAAQLGGACVEVTGVARGNPKLRAGTQVALANVGDPFTGKYTLTSTRHLFSEETGYTTSFTVSGRQERSLYGMVSGGHRYAGGGGGLVPGIVSDVKDPQKLGRVRLTFPWLAKDFTSGWARTVQAGAGNKRGTVILPEVGDEVLVGFEPDGIDEPYVLGGLYNGKDAMPQLSADPIDGASGEIAARAFVSRTGHKLEFVENDGILLSTGDGKMSVRLDKKNQTVEIKAANGITVDAGQGSLMMKAANGATLDAGMGNLTLKGQKVSAQGTTEAELTGSAQVTVRGGIVKLN